MKRPWTILFLILLGALVLPPLWRGDGSYFWAIDNMRFIAARSGFLALGALGMLLIVMTRGVDLSAVAVVALGGAVSAYWLGAGGLPSVALLLALGVGAGAGAINGAVVSFTRASPALVTLALAAIYIALADGIKANAALTPRWLGDLLAPFPTPSFLFFAPSFWLALLCAAFLALLMRYSILGVHWMAIGSNAAGADLCGVGVRWKRSLAYLLGGLSFGFMGALQAAHLRETPAYSLTLLLELLVAALVGYRASTPAKKVWLTLLAAFALTLLQNALQQTPAPAFLFPLLATAWLLIALLRSSFVSLRRPWDLSESRMAQSD